MDQDIVSVATILGSEGVWEEGKCPLLFPEYKNT